MFENHEQIPSQKKAIIFRACLPFCTLISVFQFFQSFQHTQIIFSSFSGRKAGKNYMGFWARLKIFYKA